MTRLAKLKAANSLADLANLLQFTPTGLAYVLYGLSPRDRYTTFTIPKRRGGQRTIQAPIDKLRLAQRRLSDLLQDCVDEIEATPGRADQLTHGFKRGRSIVTNARRHRRHRYVFNLDLEDFFPTINFGRVRGFFIKNRDFLLDENVATAIAQLACHNNSLPQGSPCSPVIANLIAHILDIHLARLAASARCTYTRYADDLSFSTNSRRFPVEVAAQTGDDGSPTTHVWTPSTTLRRTIERAGFRINESKTRMMYRHSRQQVTGLVVNQEVHVNSTYRRTVRAMVHRLITTGQFEAYGRVETNGSALIAKRVGDLDELSGMLGFICGVAGASHAPKSRRRNEELSGDENIYLKFLLYKDFYANVCPVIICEGRSDNIYLTCAMRRLAKEFPILADSKQNSGGLKVRLYSHPKSNNVAHIMGLKSGGGSVLGNFVITYLKTATCFSSEGMLHPVIVLYDNDDGGRKGAKAVGKFAKVEISSDDPFVHVGRNVYLVSVPKVNGKDTAIEDLFTDELKETRLGGKKFSKSSTIDDTKEYGKMSFATKVVEPRADMIDFTGFRPLLTNLITTIESHYKLLEPIAVTA